MKKLETIDDVHALFSAATASAVLGAANETGLLWRLAENPLDRKGVAEKLNIPLRIQRPGLPADVDVSGFPGRPRFFYSNHWADQD